ncbi:hypothetical protein GCM10010145_61240 [Streptomyces ruber]|uniref:NB-ARC domain-containing protein n=2 Tax=Streptomyces TaxID=1883 RepID=A0A918EZ45_9ACTN|nr:tetratricopeptide repeat protein [Streptomyces ruber]GGQ83284.1 hypothetical protein GCM10010145_61240 [Streptomyces ruber]
MSWPHRSGSPLPRQADCFQHRAEVEHLAAAVAGEQTVVPCQVLTGTGGMGKTQLAAHYARTAWRSGQLDLLVWVSASSRDAIISAYAQTGVEVAGAEPEDAERAAERFLHWAETTDRRWLIVLDDVTDPADLRGLWPPHNPRGCTLVTTRRRDAALTGPGRHRIDVGIFTPAEAVTYLTTTLAVHDRHDDPEEIAGLAADLGHLPLALAQAAAYLTDLHLGCAAYRARLADRTRTLPALLPDADGLPDDHHTTVTATWSLSIEQADRLRPRGLARPLLHLASMLDPNGTPTTVLTSFPALTYLTEHRTPVVPGDQPAQPHPVSAEDAHDALRCLHRLSLADHTPDSHQQAVRVHSLIQRVTRESLPAAQRASLARTVADALISAWPDFGGETGPGKALRANTETLMHQADDALYQSGLHPVLLRLGKSLGSSGQVVSAITHFRHLAHAAHQRLGSDHPDTLTARGDLAHWQGVAGDWANAFTSFRDLLEHAIQTLGPDHPFTLTVRGHLAHWRQELGDEAGAAADLDALLADRKRVLGSNHPDTLTTQGDLARVRGKLGDAARAVAELASVLEQETQVLGPDHPSTLTTRHNVAFYRGQAGDVAGAAADLADLLEQTTRVQSANSMLTLTTRANLSELRGKLGDTDGTVAALADLLEDMLAVLGPDHLATLSTQRDLARWRGKAGDVAGAVTDLVNLVKHASRVLGSDHPYMRTMRADLVHWQGKAGEADAEQGTSTQAVE